jgi:hypothetical protein
MKIIILFLGLLVGMQAHSSLLIPSSNQQLCGDYKVKNQVGDIIKLPILKGPAYSQGINVAKEEKELQKTISYWFNYFEKSGELFFKFKSLCYGLYNDSLSTGPNAVAIGERHLLLGTAMLRRIEYGLTDFIQGKLRQHAGNGQVPANIKLSSKAAKSFLTLHELGHILQNTHKLKFQGPTQRGKELHADCIAAYLYTLSRGKKMGPQDFMQTGLSSTLYAFAIGDLHTSSKDHHGTHLERLEAFSNGTALGINTLNSTLTPQNSVEILRQCSNYYY